MIARDLLQTYRKMAEFGDLMQPQVVINLLDEIQKWKSSFRDSMVERDDVIKHYYEALEQIASEPYSVGYNGGFNKLQRIAQEALKGDETA